MCCCPCFFFVELCMTQVNMDGGMHVAFLFFGIMYVCMFVCLYVGLVVCLHEAAEAKGTQGDMSDRNRTRESKDLSDRSRTRGGARASGSDGARNARLSLGHPTDQICQDLTRGGMLHFPSPPETASQDTWRGSLTYSLPPQIVAYIFEGPTQNQGLTGAISKHLKSNPSRVTQGLKKRDPASSAPPATATGRTLLLHSLDASFSIIFEFLNVLFISF